MDCSCSCPFLDKQMLSSAGLYFPNANSPHGASATLS